MTKTWMVRAGERAVFIDEFRDEGLVSIGWAPLGSLEAYVGMKGRRTLSDWQTDAVIAALRAASLPNPQPAQVTDEMVKRALAKAPKFWRETAEAEKHNRPFVASGTRDSRPLSLSNSHDGGQCDSET